VTTTESEHVLDATRTVGSDRRRRSLTRFRLLVASSGAATILQGLWAGIFLQHDGARDAASNWITVHARGGEVALGLAVLAAAYGLLRLRDRRDLWGGAVALVGLLSLEAYLGGLITDAGRDTLTVIHVPLALALTALSVYLVMRARPVAPHTAACTTRRRVLVIDQFTARFGWHTPNNNRFKTAHQEPETERPR
jgi:hypothetical protein